MWRNLPLPLSSIYARLLLLQVSEGDYSPDLGAPGAPLSATSSTQMDMAAAAASKSAAVKSVIPTPMRIGFLGLGIMGQGMVMNLLRSGHEVTVWNRTAQKVSHSNG